MKRFFVGLTLMALPLATVFAKSGSRSGQINNQAKTNLTKTVLPNAALRAQQNLIGEVTSIDLNSGKIVILTDAKTSVTVTVNEKTAFRRVAPGQTSLAGAEQIKMTDIKPGDRVLVPGGVTNDQTAVRQVIVMARAAITAQRDEEAEKRRARTFGGRITALNLEKKEITIQTRGRDAVEALTVEAAGKAKLLRYAPDSLKPSDAVAGSFADLRVGDQIRVLGDRSPDGTRVTAEEIISGSIARSVGSISEINTTRGEIVVKNAQTGQSTTVLIGKNTTLRRITPDVAQTLKERFERRRERRNQRTSANSNQQSTAQTSPQPNRERRRNRNTGERQTGSNPRQLFENLPAVTIAELKKGDAVLITATSAGGNNSQMTAVSIITGEAELQQILQRTQGGGRNSSNMSPGLPGNVSGGNAGNDDEP
jgi:sRNA-binding protein